MTRVILVCAGVVVAAAQARGATVVVDCAAGDRINPALAAAPAGEPLLIEVRGVCVENVLIERREVTLHGVDPAADGIRATAATIGNAAVHVRNGARFVALQNLRLADSFGGLRVMEDSGVTVTNCRLVDNTAWGVEVGSGAHATLLDTTISGNNLGGLWVGDASARCERCTIASNVDPAGYATYNVSVGTSLVELRDSSVTGNEYGIDATFGADVSLLRTTVTGVRQAIRQHRSYVRMTGGTLDGSFWVDAARLALFGVTQTAGGSTSNVLTNDSFAQFERWLPNATTVPRTTSVLRFSNAVSAGTSFGVLTCGAGGDLWCDAYTTKTSSSCGLCR